METLATIPGYLKVGSIWRSINRRHRGHLRLVKTVRASTVTVEAVGPRAPRQHRDRLYTIPISKFLRKHELVRQGPDP